MTPLITNQVNKPKMTPPNYKPSKQTKNDPPLITNQVNKPKMTPPNYKPSKQTKNDPL